MAIYNLTTSNGSRGGGASAAAKFDYLAREGKYAGDGDELREKESGNLPAWAAESPRDYWIAADEHERANGRLYRHVHAALPQELDAGEQRELARRLAQDLTAAERLPYTLAVHEGAGRNPHVHIMWSERGNDGHDRSAETWFKRANSKEPARGGAKKSRAGTSRDWLSNVREQWADRVNDALARAGREERVDHRSLAVRAAEALARGDEDRAAELSREPNVHLGPAAAQAVERDTQGQPPMRKLEAAADVARRNGAWAAFERGYRQLRDELASLARELRDLAERLPYALHRAAHHQALRRDGLLAAKRFVSYRPELGGYLQSDGLASGSVSRATFSRERPERRREDRGRGPTKHDRDRDDDRTRW